MRRALLPLTALLLVAVPLGLRPSPVAAGLICLGKPATHVMQPGEPEFGGTAGDDVVVGTAGTDLIDLDNFGGTDRACGGGGADFLTVLGADSVADGGTGNDFMFAGEGALIRGGAGNDQLNVIDSGSRAEGGSGKDSISVEQNASGDGGSGNDYLAGLSGAVLLGGSGNDVLEDVDGGTQSMDCGPGTDTYYLEGPANVRRCETLGAV